MSRLILWNSISLDGYFEGARSWDVEWLHPYFKGELMAFSMEQLRSAGMLIFGRVTYEGMAAYWKTAEGEDAAYMNSLPKTVFSRTLRAVDWANSQIANGDAPAVVRALKDKNEKDILVFGSAALAANLFEAALFDEVRLVLTPVVLGQGATLFGRSLSHHKMRLLEARPLKNGCVILRYAPDAP